MKLYILARIPTFSSKIIFDIFENLLAKKEICTKEALTENQ